MCVIYTIIDTDNSPSVSYNHFYDLPNIFYKWKNKDWEV